MLRWGNKRAAEYYECYLPKDFTRPQATQYVLYTVLYNFYAVLKPILFCLYVGVNFFLYLSPEQQND